MKAFNIVYFIGDCTLFAVVIEFVSEPLVAGTNYKLIYRNAIIY